MTKKGRPSEDQIQAQIEEARKAQRAAAKRIKDLSKQKESAKIYDTIDMWKELTDLKNETDEKLKAIDGRLSMRNLATMTEYYIYCHPKKLTKRGSDKNAKWVKETLEAKTNNYTLETLKQTANKQREKTWKSVRKQLKLDPTQKRKTKAEKETSLVDEVATLQNEVELPKPVKTVKTSNDNFEKPKKTTTATRRGVG